MTSDGGVLALFVGCTDTSKDGTGDGYDECCPDGINEGTLDVDGTWDKTFVGLVLGVSDFFCEGCNDGQSTASS